MRRLLISQDDMMGGMEDAGFVVFLAGRRLDSAFFRRDGQGGQGGAGGRQ